MNVQDIALFFCFIIALFLFPPRLGAYISRIFSRETPLKIAGFQWLENTIYRLSGVDPSQEMTWKHYGLAVLFFNFIGLILLALYLRVQGFLPLNPENFGPVPWLLSLNIAVSFVTNTNWQAYAGETTLSYMTQMIGLTVQNFLSAATGMSVLLALMRGLVRENANTLGNFWSDLVRSILYLLLPLSTILAIVLCMQGVIQNFSPYREVITLEGSTQTIPLGPVASQVAIKVLGSNGGGFFNANSAHPFENPTFLTNFLQMLSLLLLPASLVHFYGSWIGSKKHGWILFLVMFAFWFIGVLTAYSVEKMHVPLIDSYPLMEGKEMRFGVGSSILFANSTTCSSTGAINAMMTSLSPLSSGIALFNIMLGEIIFGGLGVGLMGMIMFVFLTVFLAGLMVGRTPEYLGKKIEKKEMRYVVLAVFLPGALILMGSGISSVLEKGLTEMNSRPHGLSSILYAFSSTTGNNGSAFTDLRVDNVYYNSFLGISMLLGRATILIAGLAIGGLLAKKKSTPYSVGTLSTNTLLFATLLAAVILILGALTFFSAIALGPLAEHLLMLQGISF